MTSPKPTRQQADLADVLEMVLDKGIVINADIAITVNETELIGIELRAAIASFETAAKYGLAFPSGTDMRRVEQASGREPLDDDETVDLGIGASSGGAAAEDATENPPRTRPDPETPFEEDEADEDDERASESEDDTEERQSEEAAPTTDASGDGADSEDA
ncbi:gas vesicle protein GvpJ [Halobacterium wangiae]|uniref:gas vesicle protein GvpJ n=1 Tax=Halobacterium wangiae TaxID=2902623 RepID=UPI0022B78BCB|nr:gas vesicle protein [Halobacterium wangiae]